MAAGAAVVEAGAAVVVAGAAAVVAGAVVVSYSLEALASAAVEAEAEASSAAEEAEAVVLVVVVEAEAPLRAAQLVYTCHSAVCSAIQMDWSTLAPVHLDLSYGSSAGEVV